jgi:hypothetical protein
LPGLIRDEPHHARALLPGNLDITSPSSLHDSLTRRAWESQARATTTPRVDACVTHDVSYACGTYCRVHPPKRAGAQSGQQPAGRPARRRAPGPGRDVQSLQRHGVLVVPWRRVREWRGGTQSRSWRARPRKARRPTERYVMTSRVESTRRDETPGVAPCSVLLVAFRGDRGCRSLARHGRAAAGQDNATRARQSDPMDVGGDGKPRAAKNTGRQIWSTDRDGEGGNTYVRTRCHTPRSSSPSPLGKRKTNTNPPSVHLQRNKSGNGKAPFSLLTQEGPGVRASSADKPPSFLSLAAMLLVSTRVYRDAAVPNLPPFQPSQHRNTPP